MFEKIMAVEMGSRYIKVLVGNKSKIKNYGMIKTPLDSVADGKIIDVDAVYEVLKDFITKNSISAKYISFAIHGQDIIVRHIETPIMDESALRNSVQFEIAQYLPQDGENHYVNFEIIDKIKDKNKKIYKLLVVAVPKDKVDTYVELSEKLNMELKGIDVSSNCVTRVFKDFYKKNKNVHSIGIIDIGSSSSNFILIEDDKLFMEREVAFGISNVLREISRKFEITQDEAYKFFLTNFDFRNIDEEDEIEFRIKNLFDNVFASFDKIIQFYATGKSEKSLDKIIIIGAGSELIGLDEYVNKYFDSEVSFVKTPKDISCSTDVPNSCDFKFYLNAFGLILKKHSLGELNVLPYKLKEKSININKKYRYGAGALIIIGLFILGIVFPKIYLIKQRNKLDTVTAEMKSSKAVISENTKFKSEIDNYKDYICRVEGVNKNRNLIAKGVKDISQYVPSDLTFKSFTCKKAQTIINGTTGNYNSINEFVANLQSSKQYSKASVASIKYNDELKKYDFSITIDAVGGVSNEVSK